MTGKETESFERIAGRLPEGALTPWLLLLFDSMTRLRAHVMTAIADPEPFGDFLHAADQDYVDTAGLAAAHLRRLAMLMLNFASAPPRETLNPLGDQPDDGTPAGMVAWRRLIDALHFLHVASGAFADSRAKATDGDRARVDAVLIREVRATLPAVERLCRILGRAQEVDPGFWETDLLGLSDHKDPDWGPET